MTRPPSLPLPRESLHWLLAGMALALAPLFAQLSLWVPATAAAIFGWRLLLDRRQSVLPSSWLLVPLTLAGAVAVFASHPGGFGRNASVALLVLMLAMKLMEARTRRDAVLLIYLSWFLCLCVFLFSQSLALGLYTLLPVTLLAAALLGVSHPNGPLPPAGKLRMAGTLLLQAVPVMLALFLLFPRFSGPLWGVPKDALQAMSGLSENMTPGSISQLILSDEVVLRAEFQDQPPEPQQRYWRGPVFWHFDGRTWRPGMQSVALPAEQMTEQRDPVDYTVTLEAHNRPWLFQLDLAAKPPPQSHFSHDRQTLAAEPVRTRARYAATSYLSYRLDADISRQARALALQLPGSGNPRTRTLAREWADSGAAPAAIAERALRMFREQQFVYTLAPPTLGRDSVDDFLFGSRRGFCEHYAGSFVFLMRAAGVPARVVTGYQGGHLNPIGRYLIVRQSDAHAWAEIWLPQRGWVRVDPTAAVSPSRIESGIGDALPAGEALPALTSGAYPLLSNLYLALDALNNGWNQWVLGYNQQRQMELLSWLYGSGITLQQVAQTMIAAVCLLLLGFTLTFMRGSLHKRDKLDNSYARFARKLARKGLTREPWEGPLDYGRRAAAALPEQAAAISAIAMDYVAQRYGRQYTPERYRAFVNRIRKFRP